MANFLAHFDSVNGREHLLEEHLRAVGQLAGTFAAIFASAEWGRTAGRWHDLGKYLPAFQARLRGEPIVVEHSGAGATLARERDPERGIPLAFAIAGHHSGLANLFEALSSGLTPLESRLGANEARLREIRSDIPDDILSLIVPEYPAFLAPRGEERPGERKRRLEFWIRFLFSALVDADRLDTEAFFDCKRGIERSRFPSLKVLNSRLGTYLENLAAGSAAARRNSSIHRLRNEVLQCCRAAAGEAPGHFSLTVPTGGGKTLSAMAFALAHGTRHGIRRVIAVIPYTSIIEQNAAVYRDALGADAVVEHHSALDPERLRKESGEDVIQRHQLATENWDAPVIVTTTVQFFESLFANHPARCRKLHNIARSVIILDEVQALPPSFLRSILDALQELVDHYGCTVVLATATPPALAASNENDRDRLRGVRAIVPAQIDFGPALGRVRYAWPRPGDPPMQWPALAQRLSRYRQVMAVVHRRADARLLAGNLRQECSEPVVHLSALMCPAHRSVTIAEVRTALAEDRPCRMVATQLVEAGVDLDFPAVYRALGGLDSMVQAAGRCNREGHLDQGEVVIFLAPTPPPPGTPKRALEVTSSLLKQWGEDPPLDDPKTFETYFRLLYSAERLDARNIQTFRESFNFDTVAREFRLIEDGFARTIVVTYGEAPATIDAIRASGATRQLLRGLQPYVVNIYADAFDRLERAGALQEIVEGIHALQPAFQHLYDDTYGLVVGDEPAPDPPALIV